jgi:hypothetical protein
MTGLVADLPDIDLQCARRDSRQWCEAMAMQLGVKAELACDVGSEAHQPNLP